MSERPGWGRRIVATAVLLLVSFAATTTFKSLREHCEYGEAHASRHIFWHNMFMGFSMHPALADEHQLAIDDMTVTRAAERFLRQQQDLARLELAFHDPDYGRGNFAHFNWIHYEPIAREMFFDVCRRRPREVLETFLYYKPLEFARHLSWAAGWAPTDADRLHLQFHRLPTDEERSSRGLYWNPFRLVTALLLGMAALLTWPELRQLRLRECLLWIALFLCSLIPAMAVCPLLQYLGTAIAVGTASMYVVMLALFGVFGRLATAALARLRRPLS
jgi:hypothetical protein